ncbi:glycosyltransferase family 39 protein [Candidatus Daviesbacteria bacterium]|nr:glycosyltransferase family 39 protein [Candidatus Daviesbacteria bacterium]
MRTQILSKYTYIIIIILIGAFLRFYKLSEFPPQLNHDEISQLYDAISIAQTGKDVYGNFLPVVFQSTGDYKPAQYTYLSTIPYLFWGDQEITIRITAAFFGTLTIGAVFLFMNALTKNFNLALLCSAMIAITPSEIFYSRKSFESVIGVTLYFFGLFCLLNLLEKTKVKIWGYLAALCFAYAIYLYTSYLIVVPLTILLFALIFRKTIKFQIKKFMLSLSLLLILIIPLIVLTISNPQLRFRAESVFITQDVNLGKLINYSQNPLKSHLDYIFLRFLNQFNPTLIFANGLNFTNQGFLGMGPLLFWQLPFFILGIVYLVKSNSFSEGKRILLGLIPIAMIPSSITFESYSPHRSMLAFSLMSIISAFGWYWTINLILRSALNFKLKIVVFTFISILFILNLIYFLHMYTVNYPYEKSQEFHYPFKSVAQFIWSQYPNFDQIVFDPQFGDVAPKIGVGSHYYLAYYGHFPPYKFQKEYRVGEKPREIIFDKFSIRQVYWPEDRNLKNTLVIASPWSIPEEDSKGFEIIKRFNFYNGKLAFYAIKL